MDYRLWSTLEIKLLTMGIMPKGRSPLACRIFCRRNGVKFPGKRQCDANDHLIDEIEKKFSQEKDTTMAKTKSKPKTITASIKDAKAEKSTGDKTYTFRTIGVNKIVDIGDNIREVEGIGDLVASIKAHGIINPITVTSDFGMSSKYRIVAGFRRFAAAKKVGLESVPCNIIASDDKNLAEISLSENVTRMDMTPYEECMAVKGLATKKNTPSQIAKRFGRTVRWVLVRKKLADAGEKVMEKVKTGAINLAAAAKLADLPDDAFKEVMESANRTDEWFIKNTLERYHKDLSKAPFDTACCMKCDKCSACQKDLFEEQQAICLDPVCWELKVHDFATAKVQELCDQGKNARIGDVNHGYINYDDDAYDYQIEEYDEERLKQAEEAGIEKRVLVDPSTGDTVEYYDERDLPGYEEKPEETDEEREARQEEERRQREFESVKRDLRSENIIKEICNIIRCENDETLVAVIAMLPDSPLRSEAVQKALGIEEDWPGPEDIPEDKTEIDIYDAITENMKDVLDDVTLDNLEHIYRIISAGTQMEFDPTDEEVQVEIERRNAEKSTKSEDDDDNLEDEEDE